MSFDTTINTVPEISPYDHSISSTPKSLASDEFLCSIIRTMGCTFFNRTILDYYSQLRISKNAPRAIFQIASEIIYAFVFQLPLIETKDWSFSFITSNPIDCGINLIDKAKKIPAEISLKASLSNLNKLKIAMSKAETPNVLIFGPPGSGKTTLVEAWAQEIAQNTDPSYPFAKTVIISVSASDILANSIYVGVKESRVNNLIEYGRQNPNVIYFIDELHSLMNDGTTSTNDIPNMLKKALSDGDIRIIGCTTSKEFKIIQQDDAFTRRFSFLELKTPSKEVVLDILQAKVQNYFAIHHQVSYPNEMILYALQLTKNLPGNDPAKTLSFLDEAGSLAHFRGLTSITPDLLLELSSDHQATKLTSDIGINLVEKAKKDPAVISLKGRLSDFEKLKVGVCKAETPNILIAGPPGAGKTTLVEALALEIAQNTDPSYPFANTVIISISASDILSNSKYVGVKESRVNDLIAYGRQNPNVIYFIDELHSLMRDGTNSTNSIPDMLKKALSDGDIRVIGCTTDKELEIIKQDDAFTRRFSFIDLKPLSKEAVLDILEMKAQNYFAIHHQILYPNEIIPYSLELTANIPGNDPAKTLSLLDEAGSLARIRGLKSVTPEILLECMNLI